MPRPRRIEYPGAIHHITTRGNRRLPVFEHRADNEIYLELLRDVAERQGWRVFSYCLMPNHLHLLLQTPVANLSEGMRLLTGTYTRMYNASRDVPGHVFQGRFKNQLVESDEHLKAAFAYIALNPVKPGFCANPGDWEWSAHNELLGALTARRPIAAADALGCFDGRVDAARAKYARYVGAFADMVRAGRKVESVYSEPVPPAEPGNVETRPLWW